MSYLKNYPQPMTTLGFKRLLCLSVSLPVLALAMPAFAQEMSSYHNADGTMTNDLEAAKSSWQEDAEFNGSWGLKAIKADGAYARGYTGLGSRLGVIDQPVWSGHNEFAAPVGGKDKLTFITTSGTYVYDDPYIDREPGDTFTYNGGIYVDNSGVSDHGTHVGGIAAANRDTGTGRRVEVQGVAYNAQIFAADNGDPGPEDGIVRGNDGSAYAAAWQAMIDSDVDVITNSWGIGVSPAEYVTERSWEYAQASKQYREIESILGTPEGGAYDGVLKAARSDIIIEFSAGNDYGLEPDAMAGLAAFVPDVEKNWIATMSVAQDPNSPSGLSPSNFTSICGYTKYFCVGAPGTDINSSIVTADTTGKAPGTILTDLEPAYAEFSGTSMAGPHVSGAIAVLKERFPYLSNGELANILKTTSTDMGDPGVDDVYGWGLLNLDKAMNGPGQLLGHLDANLAEGQSDTWSNDISDEGLRQRKQEEQAEVANWAETKEDLRATEQPLPAAIEPTDDFVTGIDNAKGLLSAAIDVLTRGVYTPEKFAAAIGALEADPAGKELLAYYDEYNLNWRLYYAGETDYTDFIAGRTNAELAEDTLNNERIKVIAANDNIDVLIEGGQYRVNQLSQKTDADYASSLTKSGAGALRLTGDSTYSGDTNVNGGLLAVDGSITSRAVVNAGGMLGGNGTVGRLVANQGGTVSPGASIGTLSVANDTVFKAGSNYLVEVAADGRSDMLAVGGKADLSGGNVLVAAEDPATGLDTLAEIAEKKTQYEILTAEGGVNGEFADAATPYVFFDPKLTYGAKNITLQVERLAFSSFGTTFNEMGTADGIESLGAGAGLYDSLLATTDAATVAPLLASLNGDIHATQQNALFETDAILRDASIGRVRQTFATPLLEEGSAAEPIKEPASWAQVHGSWVDLDGDGNAQSAESRLSGVLVGVDGMVNDVWTAGVLLGYTDGSVTTNGGKSDIGTLQFGAYGGARWDQWGLRLGASYARHDIETTRFVQGTTASADYDGDSLQIFAETGYEIEQNGTVFEPYLGLAHTRLDLDGFTESGAGDFNLTGQDMSANVTVSSLGLRIGRGFQWGTQTAKLNGAITWEHAFGDTDPEARLAFIGGDAFTNRGLPLADDILALEAGIDVNISDTASWGFAYKGQFADDVTDNALKASLNIKF